MCETCCLHGRTIQNKCEEKNNFWLLPGWKYISSLCRAYPLICTPIAQQPRNFTSSELGRLAQHHQVLLLPTCLITLLLPSLFLNNQMSLSGLSTPDPLLKCSKYVMCYSQGCTEKPSLSLNITACSLIATCHLQYLMFIKRRLRKFLCSSKAGITAMHRDKEGELCNLIPT